MLFVSVLFLFPAEADSLKQADDYSGLLVIPYDETDPGAGSFTFSWKYPCIDDSEPDANIVNSFYLEQIDMDETNMRFFADGYAESGESVTKDISYTVMCNNDEYFSVLLVQDLSVGDRHRIIWTGNTFSRKSGEVGAAFDLPRLLGILDSGEQDDYLIERQSEKATDIVLELIMDQIFENPESIPYYDDITFDYLKSCVSPQEDFYLDEYGNPVFYVVPDTIADESYGYLAFPVALDDILDEL